MLALPAAPAPPRRRQLLVGTALAAAAGAMAIGGQLAFYMQVRDNAGGSTTKWLPPKTVINEVAANTMLVTVFVASLLVQWAVYSVHRGDRRHAGWALGLVSVFGVALVTAQARIYADMAVKVAGTKQYGPMFYGITGLFLFLVAVGIGYALVAAFRTLGGRDTGADREIVSAAALWWHVLSGVFCFVWFVIYVVK